MGPREASAEAAEQTVYMYRLVGCQTVVSSRSACSGNTGAALLRPRRAVVIHCTVTEVGYPSATGHTHTRAHTHMHTHAPTHSCMYTHSYP